MKASNFPMDDHTLAKAETQVVNVLRVTVLGVLTVAAVVISGGSYWFTRNQEEVAFQANFQDSVLQIMESFHDTVERNIGAASAVSTEITSYAIQSNSTFPFVTLPEFELAGSHLRQQSGSHIVHWLPLVTDEDRDDWEQYAYENRFHIEDSFQNDMLHRTQQDIALGINTTATRQRDLQQQEQQSTPEPLPMTVLDDGSNYHMKIWSNGATHPKGDMAEGTGPFLPAWQRRYVVI